MEIEQIETQEIVAPAALYRQEKAVIDQQIATAKAFPRSIKRATENAIAIVTMDRETAETCNYSLPRGKKPISGPSVHLAKILAQQWGNMRIEARVIDTDATHVHSEAICWDLETNLAIKVTVKRSIMQHMYEEQGGKSVKSGKMVRMNEDMITVTGNAANSISLRNAVFAVIPTAVWKKAYNAAKGMITGDISDKNKLIARRKQVIDGFKETYGVSEREVLAAIGKAAIDHIDGDDLVVLIGIAQSIKDGDTTVEMAFRRPPSKEEKIKDAQAKKDALKEKAKEGAGKQDSQPEIKMP
jgi:hypothetical protein